MKATRLESCAIKAAPQSWEKLPEIQKWKPSRMGDVLLMQFAKASKTCQWHFNTGGKAEAWVPFGPVFIVED